MIWIVVFIVLLGLACIPAKMASAKGRDFLTWYVYGFCLWFFAMIHAIVLPEPGQTKESSDPGQDSTRYAGAETPEAKVAEVSLKAFDLNSPIDIVSYKIALEGNRARVSVKLTNDTAQRLVAVKLRARGFNAFDDEILVNGQDEFEIILQDLNVASRCSVESASVFLPDDNIRKLEISVKQARLEDGTTLESPGPEFVSCEKTAIDDVYHEYIRQVLHNNQAAYYPKQEDGYWCCCCGRPNKNSSENCVSCTMPKEAVFQVEELVEKYRQQLKEQQEKEWARKKEESIKEEELAAQKEKRRMRNTLIIAFVIILIALADFLMKPVTNYGKASNLLEAGRYEEAYSAFMKLGNYKDSQERMNQTINALIEREVSQEEYENALTWLELMSPDASGREAAALQIMEAASGKRKSDYAIAAMRAVSTGNDEYMEIRNAFFYELMSQASLYSEIKQYLGEIPSSYKDVEELIERYEPYEKHIGLYSCLKRDDIADLTVDDFEFLHTGVYIIVNGIMAEYDSETETFYNNLNKFQFESPNTLIASKDLWYRTYTKVE